MTDDELWTAWTAGVEVLRYRAEPTSGATIWYGANHWQMALDPPSEIMPATGFPPAADAIDWSVGRRAMPLTTETLDRIRASALRMSRSPLGLAPPGLPPGVEFRNGMFWTSPTCSEFEDRLWRYRQSLRGVN